MEAFRNLMRDQRFLTSLSWGLLALIISGLVLGLSVATRKVDYKWQWNRMPKYFAYYEQSEVIASEPGTVTLVKPGKTMSEVTVRDLSGRDRVYEVLTPTMSLHEGSPVQKGSALGTAGGWKPGILAVGTWTTLYISFASVLLGSVIGLFTGLARLSRSPAPNWLAIGYIELIRGTPLLVQIYIFYFFIGQVFGISNIWASILALSFFAGAYTAEIIRAGIQSIHRGQMEAARSLGMSYPRAMRHIVLPQAFKRILPPLAGQFISLIKDSSLVSIIAITDLTKAGREIASSAFSPFEAFFAVAFLYLILTFSLSMFTQYLERRFAAGD